jgi:hypothetical protein
MHIRKCAIACFTPLKKAKLNPGKTNPSGPSELNQLNQLIKHNKPVFLD